MKFNHSRKWVAASLIGLQLMTAVPAMASEPGDERTPLEMGALPVTSAQADLAREQLERVRGMSEAEIRLELEIQAAQLEAAPAQAREAGVEVTPDEEAQLKALAEAVRDQANDPNVKRKLLRTFGAVPRILAQGVGYAGMIAGDLLFAPILFMGPFMNSLISGEGNSGVANALGFSAMFLVQGAGLMGTVLLVGYAFPVVIATMLPINVTIALVCNKNSYRSQHTAQFCRNVGKNKEILDSIWNAGDQAGYAVNRFLTKPFRPKPGSRRWWRARNRR